MDDRNMRVSEPKDRLAILGIPPEVSGNLTVRQVKAIFLTLADWLIPDEPEADLGPGQSSASPQ